MLNGSLSMHGHHQLIMKWRSLKSQGENINLTCLRYSWGSVPSSWGSVPSMLDYVWCRDNLHTGTCSCFIVFTQHNFQTQHTSCGDVLSTESHSVDLLILASGDCLPSLMSLSTDSSEPLALDSFQANKLRFMNHNSIVYVVINWQCAVGKGHLPIPPLLPCSFKYML